MYSDWLVSCQPEVADILAHAHIGSSSAWAWLDEELKRVPLRIIVMIFDCHVFGGCDDGSWNENKTNRSNGQVDFFYINVVVI